MTPRREVDVEDAFTWLKAHRRGGTGTALVAVMPDAEEVGMLHGDWDHWFRSAAAACFEAVPGGIVVFQQTDRLRDGRWIDKARMIEQTRAKLDFRLPPPDLTWHKIALRREPERIDLHRPTYSHILAYGGRPGRRTPDVVRTGRPLWRDGIGTRTAEFIMAWLSENGVTTVLNPFCGKGTLLAAANARNMHAFGCDLDEERVSIARTVTVTTLL